MDTATQILVIITSSVLIVFLIFSIVTLVYFIKLIKQLRRVTEHAENVVDSVEAAASTMQRAASPLAFLKLISNIVDQASRLRKGKG
jgi:biopolymer transport protein ExbB/TolQ